MKQTAGPSRQSAPGPAARREGLHLFWLGCVIFLVLGAICGSMSSNSMTDFRTAYSSARCMVRHCDPYNQSDVQRIYAAEGGARPTDTDKDLLVITRNVYLPSEFTFTVPFALFPFAVAQALWGFLIAAAFLLASFLMWTQGARHAPVLSGGLLGFLVANSGLLIGVGNPSGLAISLCAIAVWCFLEDRFVPLGIFFLAASLSLKPHDAGFVWLYFLLAGGHHRKRALLTLTVVFLVNLPAWLWIAHLSPHWIHEMAANLGAFTMHGGINDPGPATAGGRGIDMITDLQSIFSFYRDDPRFYNAASYCVVAPLLLLWVVVTLRSKPSLPKAYFGIAAITALSMLPTYHRQYDAKLIMLVIPACAALRATGGSLARYALLVSGVAVILNGDFTWMILDQILDHWHSAAMPYLAVLPVPLSLLALAVFYLWVYARREPTPPPASKPT